MTLDDRPLVRIAHWLPITDQALHDAQHQRAWFQYRWMVQTVGLPLTLRERVTGWRTWVSPDGYVLTLYVSWRARLHRIATSLDDFRHPLRYRTRRLTWSERLTGWAEEDES